MRSKKNFFFEDSVRIKGAFQTVNVAEGLELHKGLLNAQEQAHIVAAIEAWAEAGRAVRAPSICLPCPAFSDPHFSIYPLSSAPHPPQRSAVSVSPRRAM